MTDYKNSTKLQKLKNLYWEVEWKILYFFVGILERLFGVVK
jgi:Na+/H+ antiporter NhaD/arsenite permease-like protein